MLPDFIAECSFNQALELKNEEKVDQLSDQITNVKSELSAKNPLWKLFVDGASNSTGSGVGIFLKGPHGFTASYALSLSFPTM